MKFNGIEIDPSVFSLVPWNLVQLAVKETLKEFDKDVDFLSGVSVTVQKASKTSKAIYKPLARTVVLYRSGVPDEWTGFGLLVHELVHAVQHKVAIYGCLAVKPEYKVAILPGGKKDKYFSDFSEIEAFAIQYKVLKTFGKTDLMKYHTEEYLKRGVDFTKL